MSNIMSDSKCTNMNDVDSFIEVIVGSRRGVHEIQVRMMQ